MNIREQKIKEKAAEVEGWLKSLLLPGEMGKVFIEIHEAPVIKTTITLPKRKRGDWAKVDTTTPIAQKDWDLIFSISWKERHLDILKRFQTNPGRALLEGKESGIGGNGDTYDINQKLIKRDLPYRIRRSNPGARLGHEEPQYIFVRVTP